jgi:hypothetical protein
MFADMLDKNTKRITVERNNGDVFFCVKTTEGWFKTDDPIDFDYKEGGPINNISHFIECEISKGSVVLTADEDTKSGFIESVRFKKELNDKN